MATFERITNTRLLSLPLKTGYFQLICFTLPEDKYPTYQIRFKEDKELLPKSWTKAATISRYGNYYDIWEALTRFDSLLYRIVRDCGSNVSLVPLIRGYIDTARKQKNEKAVLLVLEQVSEAIKKLLRTGKKKEKVTEIRPEKQARQPKQPKEKDSRLENLTKLVESLVAEKYSYDEIVEYLRDIENVHRNIIGRLTKDLKPTKVKGKPGRKPGSSTTVSKSKSTKQVDSTVATIPTTKQDVAPKGMVWVEMGKGRGFYAPEKKSTSVAMGGKEYIPGKFKKQFSTGIKVAKSA